MERQDCLNMESLLYELVVLWCASVIMWCAKKLLQKCTMFLNDPRTKDNKDDYYLLLLNSKVMHAAVKKSNKSIKFV